MKLSKWAKEKGISYTTAYRWAKSGKIPGCRIMETGTILIEYVKEPVSNENIFIYARVSSNSSGTSDYKRRAKIRPSFDGTDVEALKEKELV